MGYPRCDDDKHANFQIFLYDLENKLFLMLIICIIMMFYYKVSLVWKYHAFLRFLSIMENENKKYWRKATYVWGPYNIHIKNYFMKFPRTFF